MNARPYELSLKGNLPAIAKPSPNNRKVNAGNFIDAIAENPG